MITWYNWSQLEIQNKLVQAFENWFVTATSITITAGTDEYDLPCATLKIVRVEDIQNTSAPVEILPISFNDKDKYYGNLSRILGQSSVGAISYYSIRGDRFVFRPSPNMGGTYIKVYYVRRCDDLVSATDSSVIPKEYQELLMWGVVENGLIKQECTAEAMATILGRRNRLISDLMVTAEDRQIQRSRKVKQKKFYRR